MILMKFSMRYYTAIDRFNYGLYLETLPQKEWNLRVIQVLLDYMKISRNVFSVSEAYENVNLLPA